jgi:hypothetical protein
MHRAHSFGAVIDRRVAHHKVRLLFLIANIASSYPTNLPLWL